MFSLQPPRHISTLPFTSLWLLRSTVRMSASHPKATESLRSSEMTLSARTGRQPLQHYSITLSARARVGGTSSPSALAVRRLSRRSNLVDCVTGRSAGRSPLNFIALPFETQFRFQSRDAGRQISLVMPAWRLHAQERGDWHVCNPDGCSAVLLPGRVLHR